MGSIVHESNTFSPVTTGIESFKRTQFLKGDALIEYHASRGTEIGGVLKVFTEKKVTVRPTISAWAMCSGTVTRGAYLELKDELLNMIENAADELDGVLLVLHGSMTVEELEDPEGEILAAIRNILPQGTHLAATLDHHANVTEMMVENADFLIGYRTHPHVDQFDVGCQGAEHMVSLICGKPKLRKSFVKLPLLTPAENRSQPIRSLASEIGKIEDDPHVITASYFVGYPWADVSIQGASVLVIADDELSAADEYAEDLAKKMWEMRDDFQFPIHTVKEAIEIGMETDDRPFVLDELCDCTLGGASGDVIASVRYFVENGVRNAVAVGIVDSESVHAAVNAGVGSRVKLSIGGKYCKQDNPPLDFEGRVTRIAENVVGDAATHSGFETKVGKVAVVEGGGIEIVLIQFPGKIGGPSFLDKLGINPKKKKFIISKEGLNPLVTYRDTAVKILMIDSPGFNRQKLRAEDYRKVHRPIYPLDPDMTLKSFKVQQL